MADENMTAERVNVWQCIGCGRIEASQPCVGICQDRRVEFVFASDYDEALAQLVLVRRKEQMLEALVRRLAGTTPLAGKWERSYRAMQDEARRTLAAVAGDAPKSARPATDHTIWPA